MLERVQFKYCSKYTALHVMAFFNHSSNVAFVLKFLAITAFLKLEYEFILAPGYYTVFLLLRGQHLLNIRPRI